MLSIAFRNRNIRGLIITGQGKIFSLGLDVEYFRTQTPEYVAATRCMNGQVYRRLMLLPVPTVAAVNGMVHSFPSTLKICAFWSSIFYSWLPDMSISLYIYLSIYIYLNGIPCPSNPRENPMVISYFSHGSCEKNSAKGSVICLVLCLLSEICVPLTTWLQKIIIFVFNSTFTKTFLYEFVKSQGRCGYGLSVLLQQKLLIMIEPWALNSRTRSGLSKLEHHFQGRLWCLLIKSDISLLYYTILFICKCKTWRLYIVPPNSVSCHSISLLLQCSRTCVWRRRHLGNVMWLPRDEIRSRLDLLAGSPAWNDYSARDYTVSQVSTFYLPFANSFK